MKILLIRIETRSFSINTFPLIFYYSFNIRCRQSQIYLVILLYMARYRIPKPSFLLSFSDLVLPKCSFLRLLHEYNKLFQAKKFISFTIIMWRVAPDNPVWQFRYLWLFGGLLAERWSTSVLFNMKEVVLEQRFFQFD